MAAVVEHCNIGIARSAREAYGCCVHSVLVYIDSRYRFEADALEGVADVLGIVGRVWKGWHVLISAIPYDQRDASFGTRSIGQPRRHCAHSDEQGNGRKSHTNLPDKCA